jgi:protein phosphatase 2C family protein 2/3
MQPQTVTSPCLIRMQCTAEFKGPGVHHRFDNDSPDEYDMDMEGRSRMVSGHGGRVILLGDGTEIMTDSGENDTDMFDQSDDEEKDLASQVSKGQDDGKKGTQEQGTKSTETPTPAEPKVGGVADSA